MIVSLVGAACGFVIGAVLAVLITSEMLPSPGQIRPLAVDRNGNRSTVGEDREQILAWIIRLFLVGIPLGCAAIGFASASDIFGSLL